MRAMNSDEYLQLLYEHCDRLARAINTGDLDSVRDIESLIVENAMMVSGYEFDTNKAQYVSVFEE